MTIFTTILFSTLLQAPVTADPGIDTIAVRLRHEILQEKQTPQATVLQWLDEQRKDGSWADIDYADTVRTAWKPSGHLHRLKAMAMLYSTTQRSDRLAAGITSGIKFYLKRKPYSNNWWHNRIGQQMLMADALIVMQSALDEDVIAAGASLLESIEKDGRRFTGQNLVWVSSIAVAKGILEKDPVIVNSAFNAIKSTVVIRAKEGIQTDGSFHQHGPQLYSGSYGLSFAGDIAFWMYIGRGTSFAFAPEQVNAFSHLILDGHQWMMRYSLMDYSTLGRTITRRGAGLAGNTMIQVSERMKVIDLARAAEYDRFAQHMRGQAGPSVTGNKYFWRSDYMTHSRPAFLATTKLFSVRTTGAEMLNSENLKGYYLAHGATFVYRSGLEYEEIFPAWDWSRLPGVTCKAGEVPRFKNYLTGHGGFTGGVSDGTSGVISGMLDENGVRSYKTWLYFDKGVYCMGTGIASADGLPIRTSVNQVPAKRNVIYKTNGKPRQLSAQQTHENTQWVWHDSIGYIFPANPQVTLQSTVQKGTWKSINDQYADTTVALEVFSAWFDHGVNPKDAGYQYLILPGVSEKDMEGNKNTIRVLSNTKAIQAMSYPAQHLTAITFYRPGSIRVEGIPVEVDKPCILMLKHSGNTIALHAADPYQREAQLAVTFGARLEGKGVTYDGQAGKSRVSVVLPGGLEKGSTVRYELTVRR